VLLERDALLARLDALLAESQRAGRLVLLSGEAGIGKSSLAAAFAARQRLHADVLWGACDAVTPPRPFAPLADLAQRTGGQLGCALAAGDRDRVFLDFLGLLRRRTGKPRIVVFEDLHWADEATLDLLRVVGRRLGDLPVLLIGTYRDHEVGPQHPLRLALGDIPADAVDEIAVAPLSASAVAELARGSRLDAEALHAATAGNAFFVTEVLAGQGRDVPTTVRDAVLARVARLSIDAQLLIEAAAVLGQRCERDVVLTVSEQDQTALDECAAHGILQLDGGGMSFRHELARRAILGVLSSSKRIALHRRALAALEARAGSIEPARLAYHAVGAQDRPAILALSPLAGQHAASMGAHREARAHYANALEYAAELGDRGRGVLLEAHAHESAVIDDVEAALRSQERALECWRRLADTPAEAECLRALSFIKWLAGDGEQSIEVAQAAVALLEPRPSPGSELARAYATLAQRYSASGRGDELALGYAERALTLAEELSDETVAVHALTTLGVCEIYLGRHGGWHRLEEALSRARSANLAEDVTRALINLVECGLDLWRYDVVERYSVEAIEWLAVRDLDLYQRLLSARLGEFDSRRGRWDAARRRAQALLDGGGSSSQVRVRALTLVGRLQARRGEPDPWAALDEALQHAGPGDVQDLSPLRSARAEAYWLEGRLDDARREAAAGLAISLESKGEWWWSEAVFWAWKTGVRDQLPESAAEPFRLQASGRHREAAEAWAAVGCPYQEGLALSDSAATDDLSRALAIFHALGARPMALLVAERLAARGVKHIPRGPRERTRRNPHGLTEREMEILALLGDRRSNAEIAKRLIVSTKTVDHHVSSILKKLGVPNRTAAGLIGRRFAAKDGEPAATT
jgi:ATP/maltotriose-dependent transcriptional regulator MalT